MASRLEVTLFQMAQTTTKLTEEEFLDKINPQLDLPITLAAHKRGAKNATTNNQRRDDFRQIQKEAKDFVVLHDLPVPTSDLEWKQLYREMGSFFAAKVLLSRTPQVVMDLPVADIHDSKEHLRFRAVCDERITLPLRLSPTSRRSTTTLASRRWWR